jgi:hypothetical protein
MFGIARNRDYEGHFAACGGCSKNWLTMVEKYLRMNKNVEE